MDVETMVSVLVNLCRTIAVLMLVALLVACGDVEDDESAGADVTETTEPATATSASSPTVESAQASSQTVTATSQPATATPEVTATLSVETAATTTAEPSDRATYEQLNAWDVKWESLGGIALGPDRRLYVVDSERDQVLVFAPDGCELDVFDLPGQGPAPAGMRDDIAIGPDGRLYILERAATPTVFVLESDGTFVNQWGGTVGFEPDSIFDATAIEVAPDGHVFIVRADGVLQKFTSDGTFVEHWTRAGDGLFPTEARDLAIGDGTLYVLAEGMLLPFDFDGNLIGEPVVLTGSDVERVRAPWAMTVGPDGDLFVSDVLEREVVKLTPAGEVVERIAVDEPLDRPGFVIELAIDDAGNLYVADFKRKLIAVYRREA